MGWIRFSTCILSLFPLPVMTACDDFFFFFSFLGVGCVEQFKLFRPEFRLQQNHISLSSHLKNGLKYHSVLLTWQQTGEETDTICGTAPPPPPLSSTHTGKSQKVLAVIKFLSLTFCIDIGDNWISTVPWDRGQLHHEIEDSWIRQPWDRGQLNKAWLWDRGQATA